MNGAILSRRVTIVVAVLGALSLFGGFAAAVFFEPAPPVRSAGANAFSRSAVGHRAFVELLRGLGYTVRVTRVPFRASESGDSVLLLLEPTHDEKRLERLLRGAGRVLVVLPKRWSRAALGSSGWIDDAGLSSKREPERVLTSLGLRGRIVRRDGPFVPDQSLPRPALRPVQLLQASSLQPLCSSQDGTLFGWTDSARCDELFVLSDPDLIQNHGLGDGSNALLVTTFLEQIAGGDRTLVIDETLHGFELDPHVWGALGRYPLVLALVQGLMFVLVLVWVASRRLGAPLPELPVLQPGRRTLVLSTAELLLQGGRSRSILQRYLRNEERRVANACRLPRTEDLDQRRAGLLRVEEQRRPSRSLVDLADAVAQHTRGDDDGRMLLEVAREIHTWRTEMMHGTS